MIAKEEYYIRKYNCRSLTESALEKLKNPNKIPEEKVIMGVPTYRITENLIYMQKF